MDGICWILGVSEKGPHSGSYIRKILRDISEGDCVNCSNPTSGAVRNPDYGYLYELEIIVSNKPIIEK